MAYTTEEIDIIFTDILEFIKLGNSLTSALKRDGMPCDNTFDKWCLDETKMTQYAQAREKRAEVIFEEILTIADDASGDKKYTETGETMDAEYVARSRIKIDARKWMLGKMQPKKYGDKVQTELSGEITTNIISLGSGIKPE